MNVETVIIGNEEVWAVKGIKGGLRGLFLPAREVVLHVPTDPISNGWTDLFEKLLVRVQKVNDYASEKGSIGVAIQAGMVVLPGQPVPVLNVTSAICLGADKVALGYSFGPPLPFITRSELYVTQVAAHLVKLPPNEGLDDLVLEITKGSLSLSDVVEQSVRSAIISYKAFGNQPYVSIDALRELVEFEGAPDHNSTKI